MRIFEINANGNNNDVTVVAVFASDKFENMTACYDATDSGEILCVYDGRINIEDPGVGPYEEYADRGEALSSEFGDLFRVMFGLAEFVGKDI